MGPGSRRGRGGATASAPHAALPAAARGGHGRIGACQRPWPRGSAAAARGARATGGRTAALLASLPCAGLRPGDVRGTAEPAGPGTARGRLLTVTRGTDAWEGTAVQPRPGWGSKSASGPSGWDAARAPARGRSPGPETRGVGRDGGWAADPAQVPPSPVIQLLSLPSSTHFGLEPASKG